MKIARKMKNKPAVPTVKIRKIVVPRKKEHNYIKVHGDNDND